MAGDPAHTYLSSSVDYFLHTDGLAEVYRTYRDLGRHSPFGLGGKSGGIHTDKSLIESRAASDVGTPHASKNGPRLRPT